jgi:hypothetical protein
MTEKYPLEDQHKRFSNSLQVTNRSDSDDLKSSEIKIEVRIQGLYIISNYVPNIEHLPGVIEVDVSDSFKILCRRLDASHATRNCSQLLIMGLMVLIKALSYNLG